MFFQSLALILLFKRIGKREGRKQVVNAYTGT